MNARNPAESTEPSRFPSPPARVEFCSVGSTRAGLVFEWAITQPIVRDDPWHHIHPLCIRALTSARAFAAATWCARPRARRRRSLNILTAREPMSLSSRRRLILLASHRMALTRERKNPSQIAREIEIFTIFAWLVPTLVPKHNSDPCTLYHMGKTEGWVRCGTCHCRVQEISVQRHSDKGTDTVRRVRMNVTRWLFQNCQWQSGSNYF